ncbi:MAG TPA: hypothetical protein VFR35_20325, partial [Actinoplanes sp.]|nr:hypothetical protein [Actinoplanes sp.]
EAPRAGAVHAAAQDVAEPTEEIAQAVAEGTRSLYRPGLAADAARALVAATAEEATQQSEPALASRAADLAARVADLVARAAGPEPPQDEIDTWELHSAAVRPGESTNRQPDNSGSSEALPSRARRQAAPQIGNGWVSDDVRLTRDEGQGSRGAGWGFNRFEELRSPRTDRRPGVQGEKGRRSAWGKERPSVENGEGRAEEPPSVETGDGRAGERDRAGGEDGRAGPRQEDASGWGEERRGEELQAFRIEDRRAFRSYDRRTTRAEERRAARAEQDRVGPGDGRPVARSEEHRPAGAGEWRMNSGDDPRTGQSSGEPPVDLPTTNLAERAESIRRTAARLASNSARGRLGTRRADLDSGVATRRNHNP